MNNDKIFESSSKKVIPLTLIYLRSGSKILLIKRNPQKDMVAGKWVGLGGKLEPDEDLFESVKREFLEETGLNLKNPILRGTFTWVDESNVAGTLYIFIATDYEGDLLENCDEGELFWHDIQGIEDLEYLAEHQKLFLSKIVGNDKYFYTGIAVYKNGKLIEYADNEKYFGGRNI